MEKKTKLPSTEQVWTCGDVELRIRDTIQIAITELTRDMKCGDEDVWR